MCDRDAVTSSEGVKLVPTDVAAKAIGVSRRSLVRWWNDGDVTPALVTPGGHARWDIADLKRQLKEKEKPSDD
jgi:predicted site-specific integrase-resolvase